MRLGLLLLTVLLTTAAQAAENYTVDLVVFTDTISFWEANYPATRQQVAERACTDGLTNLAQARAAYEQALAVEGQAQVTDERRLGIKCLLGDVVDQFDVVACCSGTAAAALTVYGITLTACSPP